MLLKLRWHGPDQNLVKYPPGLMTKVYKTKSGLNPPFVKDIFIEQNIGDNLRQGNDSQLPKLHTTAFGIETIYFLGNRLWSTLPNAVKLASTHSIFKNLIRCWKEGENCSCRICKTNIPQVWYLA